MSRFFINSNGTLPPLLTFFLILFLSHVNTHILANAHTHTLTNEISCTHAHTYTHTNANAHSNALSNTPTLKCSHTLTLANARSRIVFLSRTLKLRHLFFWNLSLTEMRAYLWSNSLTHTHPPTHPHTHSYTHAHSHSNAYTNTFSTSLFVNLLSTDTLSLSLSRTALSHTLLSLSFSLSPVANKAFFKGPSYHEEAKIGGAEDFPSQPRRSDNCDLNLKLEQNPTCPVPLVSFISIFFILHLSVKAK